MPGVYQRSRLLRSVLEEEVADDQDAHGARKVPRGVGAHQWLPPRTVGSLPAGSASPCPTRRPAHFPLVDLSHVNGVVEQDVLADIAEIVAAGRSRTGLMWAGSRRRSPRYAAAAECVGVVERARRPAARADRGRRRAGRRGDRPRSDVHRHVRGGQPGRRDAGRGRRQRGATTTSTRTRSRPRSGRARACVLPVHLYGQMADMRRLRRGRRPPPVLGWSRTPARRTAPCATASARARAAAAAAFSFYPTKNLGAMGDAGALVTDDPGLAERRARAASARRARALSPFRADRLHRPPGHAAGGGAAAQAAAARRLEPASGARPPALYADGARRCRRRASPAGA